MRIIRTRYIWILHVGLARVVLRFHGDGVSKPCLGADRYFSPLHNLVYIIISIRLVTCSHQHSPPATPPHCTVAALIIYTWNFTLYTHSHRDSRISINTYFHNHIIYELWFTLFAFLFCIELHWTLLI